MARLLCLIGIHRWETRTERANGLICEYQRCIRHSRCRHAQWMLGNEEPAQR